MTGPRNRHKYTPEDNALLRDANSEMIGRLSERWGISRSTLEARRSALRSGTLGQPSRRPPARKPIKVDKSRFARPDWFDEDVAAMSRGQR